MKYILYILLFIFVGCTPKSPHPATYKSHSFTAATVKGEEKLSPSTTLIKDIEQTVIAQNSTIALVYPSVNIGKYALEATNSINTYLLYKKEPFAVETYDMFLQNKENILKIFTQIQAKGITKVIALLTADNLQYLLGIPNLENVNIYLPLVNKYEVGDIQKFKDLQLTFGGISYKTQFKKLFEYSNGRKLVEFYDNTQIGSSLHHFLKSHPVSYTKVVDDNNGRYKYFLKNNKHIANSAIVLNTPIVKSSILLSSIIAEQLSPSIILSTQLNYTPLIFSLTQELDRKKLIVANSIGEIPLSLIEYNEILGNSLSYNWVNYSASIGAEFLSEGNIDFFKDLEIKDHQIVYPVNLYEARGNSFSLIK